jgi:hypothetical protein
MRHESGAPGATGAWARPAAGWADTRLRACTCCGRPLFGPSWQVAAGAETREFCEPACERLYVDYWLVRHGSAPAGA